MALNRIVDLSFAAAQKLGVEGLAKVRVEEVNLTDPELAEMMVSQLKMEDPVKVQPFDEPPSMGDLTPGLMAEMER